MKIYCSGIGGIGLSAYAALQAQNGHTVLGSDRSDSPIIEDLQSLGIHVFLNQDGSCVPSDCDLFVYSEAIPVDAPERVRARDFGIVSQSYFHALGELTKDSFVIAVCGTHGKSSTTAMTAKVLIDALKDPSVVVGTKMKELNGRNWRKGKSDIFVVEACEYRRSFHYLSPDIALMTNVDGDHFDSFKDIDDYQEAFVTFLKRLPQEGIVITHGNDDEARGIAEASGKTIIDADSYDVPAVGVPGEHMRQNARLAFAAAKYLSISDEDIVASLKGFSGTWRRMEMKGTTRIGAIVIDDYGHHPKEITATLSAMREAYKDQRIVCVFQPHTHDRTLKLYDEFVRSFTDCDMVIIPNIYNARSDIETGMVDVPSFVADIAKQSKVEAIDGIGIDHTYDLLQKIHTGNDVIIAMGAGNITDLAAKLVQ
jgi:UDP-N-acetylmuramate--alanine ligase